MQGQHLLGWAIVLLAAGATGCDSAPLVQAGASSSSTASAPPHGPPVPLPQSPILPVSNINTQASPGQLVAVILATVNGYPILESEVDEAVGAPRPGMSRADQMKLREKALDAIIERELIYQEAMTKIKKIPKKEILDQVKEEADRNFNRWLRSIKANFHSDEEFQQYLRYMNTSLEKLRRIRERSFIGEEFLRSNVSPALERASTPELCLEYYQAHPEEFMRRTASSGRTSSSWLPSIRAGKRLSNLPRTLPPRHARVQTL